MDNEDLALLRQALEALQYHQEQTRQIQQTADAIDALLARLAGMNNMLAWVHECGALGTRVTIFQRHATKAAAEIAANSCDFNGRVFPLSISTLERRIESLQAGCQMPYPEAEELAIRELAPDVMQEV